MEKNIAVIPVAPLGANCVILTNKKKHAIIIDPGGEAEKIGRFIDEHGLKPVQIFLTHGHFDHIGAANELKLRFDIPVYGHVQDSACLLSAAKTAKAFGESIGTVELDHHFDDGEIIPFGEIDIKVIHTPGHSAGSVCFYIASMGLLVSGDTLFCDGIGRTDFQGSSPKAIEHSIKEKLYKLPDETVVIPGHGETTTIGDEAAHNPYVRRD